MTLYFITLNIFNPTFNNNKVYDPQDVNLTRTVTVTLSAENQTKLAAILTANGTEAADDTAYNLAALDEYLKTQGTGYSISIN
jgi:hypothetical protein